MKRTKAGKAAIYIVLVIMFGLVAESCGSSNKRCGCLGDLSGNYKAHRKRGY